MAPGKVPCALAQWSQGNCGTPGGWEPLAGNTLHLQTLRGERVSPPPKADKIIPPNY